MTDITDIEHTLDALIELGDGPLLQRHPGVGALRAIAGEAAAADGDRTRYAELVAELQATARPLFGGYGSFRDYPIEDDNAARFEQLKDELARQIGRL
jgi:uncharacterized protein YceH (UPF0502 family)